MRLRFKLYRGYDEDLMGLYETVGPKGFCALLRESMRIMIRPGYIPKAKPPEHIPPYSGERSTISVEMNLIKAADNDLKDLVSHVKSRKVTQFLKLSLRFYMGRFACLTVLLDTPLETKKVYCVEGEIFLFTGGAPAGETKNKKSADGKPRKLRSVRRDPGVPYMPQGYSWMGQMPFPFPGAPQGEGAQPVYPYPYYPYMPYGYGMPMPQAGMEQMMPQADMENAEQQAKTQVLPAPQEGQPAEVPEEVQDAEPEEIPAEETETTGTKTVESLQEAVPSVPEHVGALPIAEPIGGEDEDDVFSLLENMM